eukprot:3966230-Pyramimonas_sp.AAC.1
MLHLFAFSMGARAPQFRGAPCYSRWMFWAGRSLQDTLLGMPLQGVSDAWASEKEGFGQYNSFCFIIIASAPVHLD